MMPAKKLLQLSIKLSYEFPGSQGNEGNPAGLAEMKHFCL